jgi:acyl-CoA synthetase (AMP-forming)/AMP-acid ligase II
VHPVPVFDPEVAAELIGREQITVFPGPPTIYHALLQLPPERRRLLQSLRLAVTGAASVPVELLRRMSVELGFEDPVATAAAIDDGGWFHTGDIGVLDPTGGLEITDRLKDMYIVGGFNAYPAEIESALLEAPGVAQVAVVGVPDDRLGEVGVAFVVARAGSAVDPADVMTFARDRLANFKVPRQVVVVGDLPLNASGKVMKHLLRQQAAGKDDGEEKGAGI